MTIKLLAIGKTDSTPLGELISDYEGRIRHYVRFELETLPDIKNAKNRSEAQQKEKEGTLLLQKLKPTDRLVLLDEKGKQLDSVAFAQYLQKQMNSGTKRLVLAIGGAYGFGPEVRQRADGLISLSAMTFSHQMVRLFAIEQLYRAFTILRNEPYHHR